MSHSPLLWLVREVTEAAGESHSQWATEEAGGLHCQRATEVAGESRSQWAMERSAEAEKLEEVRMQLHPIGSQ